MDNELIDVIRILGIRVKVVLTDGKKLGHEIKAIHKNIIATMNEMTDEQAYELLKDTLIKASPHTLSAIGLTNWYLPIGGTNGN